MIFSCIIILNVMIYNYNLKKKQFKREIKTILNSNSCLQLIHVLMELCLWLLCIHKSVFVGATNIINVYGFYPDVLNTDEFGSSISTYGNFTIIGAPSDDDPTYNSGSAYIFDHNSKEFTKLTPNDTLGYSFFGGSVGIHDNVAVVRAALSVYIYQYNVKFGTWNQSAKLTVNDAWSVGISKYNNYYYNVIVGASTSNKAYIFKYNSSNAAWNQHTILIPDDVENYDVFGWSVAIDEKFAIVGAHLDDDLGSNSGSAYIFRYEESTDTWSEFAKLTASDGAAGDYFGRPVAIHNNTAIVGAAFHDHNGYYSAGSAYIFKYNQASESWIEVANLTESDTGYNAVFGWTVDIFGDFVIVGARHYYNYDGLAGAYVFEYDDTNHTWNEIAKLVPIDSEEDDSFVNTVAINENCAFVGCGFYCNEPGVLVANIHDLQMPSLTLTVDYSYKTGMDIIGLDDNNNYFSDNYDECNSDRQVDDTSSRQLPEFGCYSITFYDCDDSVINDRTDNHGRYEIYVYGELAAVGGYYSNSETQVICTNDIYNHVSFCIMPQFCNNNQQLWTDDESDISMTSYKAMNNSTMTLCTTIDNTHIDCSGDHSCYNTYLRFVICFVSTLDGSSAYTCTYCFVFVNLLQHSNSASYMDIRCTGFRSFLDSYLTSMILANEYVYLYALECIGVDSCDNVAILFDYNNISRAIEIDVYVTYCIILNSFV